MNLEVLNFRENYFTLCEVDKIKKLVKRGKDEIEG